ncbi:MULTISPECIES: siderophore-interacting protein [unclassified Vibrio]|uniref:siderophore-interacting protein n=1 Tax=unclassified Vibrio TaxID=2614977 RepID=UPI00159D687A|nr:MULTISPECIES: siderophore-interacting protein [unclassified Vibrio]NVN81198.1 siderophore-interacting protein [Vibrio sp. Scap16]QLE95020.1 siderophore-interacting protein [Vibrio sp. Scap24]
MSKPSPITLTVTQTSTITPNMQRITLSGEGLSKYPTECAGGYIKLLFSPLGTTDLSQLNEGERPTMRTYTIRQYNPVEQFIEVDFVRHITKDLQCGFAARWAMSAQVGDTISVAGPGLIQGLNLESDWFFLVADMTSLPALSAKVKTLPEHATGHAVVQINSAADKQALEAPEGIKITWLIEDKTEETLSQTVRNIEWLDGQVSIWTACEFESMRELRQYFRNEKEVAKENIYISSYWKHGVTEDGHKVLKQQDAQALAS